MTTKILCDSDSIFNFLKYYTFDKNNSSIIYDKLIGFIVEKIKKGDLIIIDKVYKELKSPETFNFKKNIRNDIFSTDHLLDKIELLFNEFKIQSRIDFLGDDLLVQSEYNYYINKYADLYLIACCDEFKKQNLHPILVTEETVKKDKKIVEKIPTICKRKEIECQNLPYLLFIIYKNELIFDLKINN